jgi:hypothetical protein
MEYDFSKEAKSFLESLSAKKRSGPKSAAQTPAKKDEQRSGSEKNETGSAGKDGKNITFSDKVTSALENKVKEHNEKYSNKVTLTQLKKVYRRGAGAFSSSHRPNKSRGQWAMARVNMFLKMMAGGKVKDAYRRADQDIAKGSEEYYVEEDGKAFIDFDELDFAFARLDFVKIDASMDSSEDAEDIDYSEAEKKTLNKPFRLPSGSKKKFGVYVKNPKTGNVIMVKFGDPNMEIKRDDPDRRRNFRARHNCDTAKDKTSPRYWSCKFWAKKPVSKLTSSEALEWDEEEILSEWSWDDETFVEQEELLEANSDLISVEEIIEDEGEL